MRKRWIWLAPAAIAGIILFTFIGGELVMHLWNWLLPPLFGWRLITFWQALGLLLLCRILFGGWGGSGGGKGHMRHRMREGIAGRMGGRMGGRGGKKKPGGTQKIP